MNAIDCLARQRGLVKVACITAGMPFGPQEAFLIPEVLEYGRQGAEVLLIPRSCRGSVIHQDARPLLERTVAEPLFSRCILRAAAKVCSERRYPISAAIAVLRKSRDPWVLAKNLLVVPKALWLADLVQLRGVSHIHAHWASTTATMAMIASRVSGIAWSFTAHRGDIVDNNLLRAKALDASFVRVISESGRRLIATIAGRDAIRNVCVIHMGVATEQHVVGEPSERPLGRILCPANLLPVKGHRYLLQAISILKRAGVPCHLIIAGEGPLRHAIEQQVRTDQITDRVSLVGQLPHEEILAFYRNHQVDAVVLPSVDLGGHVHEGIPVTLIEAMAFGVPTISTTTGGIPELLRGAGILVPPADAAALADAIGSVLHDPRLRSKLSDLGRQRVEAQFSVRSTVKALLQRIAAVDSNRVKVTVQRPESGRRHKAA